MVKQADKNPESTKKVSTENQDNLNTGISKENSKKVAEALNEVLADEFVLYTKTLNFHWMSNTINYRQSLTRLLKESGKWDILLPNWVPAWRISKN